MFRQPLYSPTMRELVLLSTAGTLNQYLHASEHLTRGSLFSMGWKQVLLTRGIPRGPGQNMCSASAGYHKRAVKCSIGVWEAGVPGPELPLMHQLRTGKPSPGEERSGVLDLNREEIGGQIRSRGAGTHQMVFYWTKSTCTDQCGFEQTILPMQVQVDLFWCWAYPGAKGQMSSFGRTNVFPTA